jgi:hypothetical protein
MSGKLQRMYRHRLFTWAVMLVCTSVVLLPVPVMAEWGRITRGDVQAVLEALPTGGMVVLIRASDSAVVHAAPVEGTRGEIRPLPAWDGRRYCVDDWHVLLLGWFAGGDQSFSRQDAEGLSGISLSFTLAHNGSSEALDTVRTPIKRILAPGFFGWDKGYGFQEGKIMSPDELGVGEYTLTVVSEIGGSTYETSNQFFIDPSDSVTCSE